jgi:hypothetical protein
MIQGHQPYSTSMEDEVAEVVGKTAWDLLQVGESPSYLPGQRM